jgi:hypothetical protein
VNLLAGRARRRHSLSYWRRPAGDEVAFVLYGARGLVAIEVKMADLIA